MTQTAKRLLKTSRKCGGGVFELILKSISTVPVSLLRFISTLPKNKKDEVGSGKYTGSKEKIDGKEVPNGNGTFTETVSAEGVGRCEYKYTGQWEHGKKNGEGELNIKYSLDGQGEIIADSHVDGRGQDVEIKHTGIWKDNKIESGRTEIKKKDTRYEGETRGNGFVRHGNGILYSTVSSDETVIYNGEWVDDLPKNMSTADKIKEFRTEIKAKLANSGEHTKGYVSIKDPTPGKKYFYLGKKGMVSINGTFNKIISDTTPPDKVRYEFIHLDKSKTYPTIFETIAEEEDDDEDRESKEVPEGYVAETNPTSGKDYYYRSKKFGMFPTLSKFEEILSEKNNEYMFNDGKTYSTIFKKVSESGGSKKHKNKRNSKLKKTKRNAKNSRMKR